MVFIYNISRLRVCAYSKEFIRPILRNLRYAALPSKKKCYTVLRSPHVDKKSREQFEFSTVKMILYPGTSMTLPAGVSGVYDRRVLAVYGSFGSLNCYYNTLCKFYTLFK